MTGPAVGSLADEAAQLLSAVTARLERLRHQAGESAAGAATTEPEHGAAEREGGTADSATGHLTCVGWCPICRGSELLSGERPEITEKLIDTALLVVGTLRTMIAQHAGSASGVVAEPDPSGQPPSSGAVADDGSPGPGPTARPGVERIDIR